MKIKKIELMDIDLKEAIIIVKENDLEVTCFSCPCLLEIGSIIKEPLECIDTKNVVVCEENAMIQKDKGFFGYKLQGKIENLEEGLVNVNGFRMHIDVKEIPNDVKTGMYICFETSRIDIW